MKNVEPQDTKSGFGIVAGYQEKSQSVNETAGQGGGEQVGPSINLERVSKDDECGGYG